MTSIANAITAPGRKAILFRILKLPIKDDLIEENPKPTNFAEIGYCERTREEERKDALIKLIKNSGSYSFYKFYIKILFISSVSVFSYQQNYVSHLPK